LDWCFQDGPGSDGQRLYEIGCEAFGKPQIQMIGDRTLYPNWVNVIDLVSLSAFRIIGQELLFRQSLLFDLWLYGRFLQYKDPNVALRFARILADPMKSLFFPKRIEKGGLDAELNKKLI